MKSTPIEIAVAVCMNGAIYAAAALGCLAFGVDSNIVSALFTFAMLSVSANIAISVATEGEE